MNQSRKSGLLINPNHEIVTYVILHPGEATREAMKFVVNESTGWYCAGTRIDLLGTAISLQYDIFDQYKELYLNDNHMTVCEILNEETAVYDKASSIKELNYALEVLKEDGHELTEELIIKEAEYVLGLFFEEGTSSYEMKKSPNRRERLYAKQQICLLKKFIEWAK